MDILWSQLGQPIECKPQSPGNKDRVESLSALIRHWSKLFLGLWEYVADFAPHGGGGGLGTSGGEAKAAALHTDLQAVCRLTAGVDDATVHVAGQVTVAALLRHAAAAET